MYIEAMIITSFSGVIVALVYFMGSVWFGFKFDSNVKHLCLTLPKSFTSRLFSWACKDSKYFALLGLMVMLWPFSQLWLLFAYPLR